MLTQRFKSFQLNGIQIGRIGRQEKQVKPRSSNENMRSSVKTSNIKMILLEFLNPKQVKKINENPKNIECGDKCQY